MAAMAFALDRVRAERARWAVLHQVMEKVGARPYVVVYFNADADLPAIPDTSFMQELHTALDARHRDRLKVISSSSLLALFSSARALNAGCAHISGGV